MLNQVNLIGRVGRVEVKTFSSGARCAYMSLATTKTQTKDGVRTEATTWHSLRAYGKLVDIVDKYITVGDLIYISGEFETSKYQANDGTEKTAYYVFVNNLKMLGGKKKEAEDPPQPSQITDDEIPF